MSKSSPEAIRELRETLARRIRVAQQGLIALAETCSHVHVTTVENASNYDGVPRCWKSHFCEDCGTAWETPL